MAQNTKLLISARRRAWIGIVLLLVCFSNAIGSAKSEIFAINEPTEFIGVAGKKLTMYQFRDLKSPVLAMIPDETKLSVIEKKSKWTKVSFEGMAGYVDTKYVEMVQRRDPFAGNMPGVREHQALALVLEDLQFKPLEYRYPIQIQAGTYISIADIQGDTALFPYMRLPEYEGIPLRSLSLQEFVPWQQAKPGDLIYSFSTFYNTSTTKKFNSGRMKNIDLACQRLNGTIIPSDEVFSFNAICGPYTEENGYRLAPILSADSQTGYGGGVCQVCTTLYNIVLRIPAVIEEMHWHAQGGTKYAPAGFDATVGSKSDMQFRNVLPYAVQIGFTSGNGVMTASLYRAIP